MAKKKVVEVYQLVCSESGDKNYVVRLKRDHKNLQIKKYCPRLRKHTLHKAKKA